MSRDTLNGHLQTLLITVCIGLSAWTLKTVSDMKSDAAAAAVKIDATNARVDRQAQDINGLSVRVDQHSQSIEALRVRMAEKFGSPTARN